MIFRVAISSEMRGKIPSAKAYCSMIRCFIFGRPLVIIIIQRNVPMASLNALLNEESVCHVYWINCQIDGLEGVNLLKSFENFL